MNWASVAKLGLIAALAAYMLRHDSWWWVPLAVVAFAAALYAAYRRGYGDGGDEMERLYKNYPPRCQHEGCLCVYGAMQDNPACPWHGDRSKAA